MKQVRAGRLVALYDAETGRVLLADISVGRTFAQIEPIVFATTKAEAAEAIAAIQALADEMPE